MCVCVCARARMHAYVYVHMHAGAFRGQKRESNPLELELQATVSCRTRVLGTILRSSARSANTLNPSRHKRLLHCLEWAMTCFLRIGVEELACTFLTPSTRLCAVGASPHSLSRYPLSPSLTTPGWLLPTSHMHSALTTYGSCFRTRVQLDTLPSR